MRVDEVAEALRLSPISVRRRIAAGELGATKLGRAVRVSAAEVERYVAAGSTTRAKR
jgi:excisionase family DNA binding protein